MKEVARSSTLLHCVNSSTRAQLCTPNSNTSMSSVRTKFTGEMTILCFELGARRFWKLTHRIDSKCYRVSYSPAMSDDRQEALFLAAWQDFPTIHFAASYLPSFRFSAAVHLLQALGGAHSSVNYPI